MIQNIELIPGEYTMIRHNGEAYTLKIKQNPIHNGCLWAWKVDAQIFSKDDYAKDYLKRRVSEFITGKRYIDHAPREVPYICGSEGLGCRLKYRDDGTPMFSMLCSECPVAEQMHAERDGLTLVYAVEQ